MQLSDLNLNRYLYRANQNTNTPDASSAGADQGVGVGGVGGGSIVSNTLITGVILQSSGSDNRIEINPDDTLVAYNNGNIILQIDRNGLTVDGAVVVNATIDDLTVNNMFTYDGIEQPVIYTGFVNGFTGALIAPFPVGWSGIFLGGPGLYQITHNLGLAYPQAHITVQSTGGVAIPIVTSNPNNFQVGWKDVTLAQVQTDFTFSLLHYLP